MPQLQPGDFSPQLIWLAITFALLYVGLSRLALPRIAHVLAERKSRIGGDIEKAREAQALSEKTMEQYEAELAAAKGKGQSAIRTSREALDRELSEKRSDLDRQIAAKAAEIEKTVQSMLQRAAGEMESMTAGVVNDIVKQLAGVEVSEEEVRAALRQSPKE
jgi:F-type H+-transporting ATPase subunit b